MNLSSVIASLKADRDRLDNAITVLNDLNPSTPQSVPMPTINSRKWSNERKQRFQQTLLAKRKQREKEERRQGKLLPKAA